MATLKAILLTLSFLLTSVKVLSCETEPALDAIMIDIKRSSRGVSGYEVLVKKKVGQHELADLSLLSEKDDKVIFSISTLFHDASSYKSDKIYESYMKSWVLLADSEIDFVEIIATYNQAAGSGALLMCAPKERVTLRALVERYHKSKQQGPEAGAR